MDYSSFGIAKDTEAWWKKSAEAAGIKWASYLEPTSGFCTYDFFNSEKDMVLDVKWHPTPMGRVNPFYRDYIERGSWGVAKPDDVDDKLKKHSTVFNNLNSRFPFIVILQAGWAYILNARILEQEARTGGMKFQIVRLSKGEWQLIIKCGDYSSNKALVTSHRMDPQLWEPTCKESRCLNMDKWMVGEAP